MSAEEILKKHCPYKNVSGNTEYFTKEILEAMEEYKSLSQSQEGIVERLVNMGYEVLFFQSENKIKIEVLRFDLHVASGYSWEEVLLLVPQPPKQ